MVELLEWAFLASPTRCHVRVLGGAGNCQW